MSETVWIVLLRGEIGLAPEQRNKMLEETGVYREVSAEAWNKYTEKQQELLLAKKEMLASTSSPITATITNIECKDR